jgi:molybdenum cofactor guanylyltransferase
VEALTTIVLAGGASSRMGRPKALLSFGGETLIERIVRRMAGISVEVVVVSGPHLTLPQFSGNVQVVSDENPRQGPLAGIFYGLRAATTDLCFACGCDLPFVRPELAGFLVDRLSGADGAMFEWNGFPQPLLAVYRKRLAASLSSLIEAGERRAVSILEHARIVLIPSAELHAIDPEGLSFLDVDTEEAYREALQRLAAEPS